MYNQGLYEKSTKCFAENILFKLTLMLKFLSSDDNLNIKPFYFILSKTHKTVDFEQDI